VEEEPSTALMRYKSAGALAQATPVPTSLPAPRQIPQSTLDQIAAIVAAHDKLTATQKKIGSQLLYASQEHRGIPRAPGVPDMPLMRSAVAIDAEGKTMVDIHAEVGDAVLARIASLGGSVVSSTPEQGRITALVPIDRIEDLAAMQEVQFVDLAALPASSAGAVHDGDTSGLANLAP